MSGHGVKIRVLPKFAARYFMCNFAEILNGMLSNPLRYALFWSAGLFLLNAFIVPLLSGSEDITLFTVLGKAVIWGLAGVAIYFILKNKMKNNAK